MMEPIQLNPNRERLKQHDAMAAQRATETAIRNLMIQQAKSKFEPGKVGVRWLVRSNKIIARGLNLKSDLIKDKPQHQKNHEINPKAKANHWRLTDGLCYSTSHR
jgi:hypothetical protein